MLKTLFLQAPSFDGFDGGAGSRFQAKREIRSFWFPTWLTQPAALVPDSRVVDAPAEQLGVEECMKLARTEFLPDIARRFTEDCCKLGIVIYGTFILGLPGETRETIEKNIQFAIDINPHTVQVSLVAPYPGTHPRREALENGWLPANDTQILVNGQGVQVPAISYPHLSSDEIFHGVEVFFRRFYFRPAKIWEIVKEILTSPEIMRRRLREGVEFLRFLRAHHSASATLASNCESTP